MWVSKCWCGCTSMCSCVLGCVLGCGTPFCSHEGGNTGLPKHGDPVFPHFYPLNQNLAPVRTRRGADGGL